MARHPRRRPLFRVLVPLAVTLAVVAGRELPSSGHGHHPAPAVAFDRGWRIQVTDVRLQDRALGSVADHRPDTALVTVRVAFTNLGGAPREVGPYSTLTLRDGPGGPAAPQDPGFVGGTDPLTSESARLVAPEHTATVWRSFAVARAALSRLALDATPDVRVVGPRTIAARLPVPRSA